MDYILPERLLALVRPAFDLVLRRIRSLKRCVQACGCKIMTPRYACNLAPGCISSEPTFAGLRKTKKKKTRGPKKRGPRKKGKRGFLWQSLTSLEMQPGAKLRRISRGHYFAATRLRSVLDFESFAGRGQMLDGRVLEASQVEYNPFGKPPLQREVQGMQGFPALNFPHDLIQNCSMDFVAAIFQQNCAPLAWHRSLPGCATCPALKPRQAAEPPLSPGPMLYVLYALYLTRQAAEPPLSPGSMLYVLYVLYLTRQPAEPPLSPGSMLYVLYVLYLTRQPAEPPLSPSSLLYVLYVLYIYLRAKICSICAI